MPRHNLIVEDQLAFPVPAYRKVFGQTVPVPVMRSVAQNIQPREARRLGVPHWSLRRAFRLAVLSLFFQDQRSLEVVLKEFIKRLV
jgi:hypothetical protein